MISIDTGPPLPRYHTGSQFAHADHYRSNFWATICLEELETLVVQVLGIRATRIFRELHS